MSIKFSELTIGQTFTDGEFTIMKLRGNDAKCAETGNYASFDPDQIVDENDDAPTLHDSPTEIERAAITLLLEFTAHHPLLELWIKAIASDPDEFRRLDDFAKAQYGDAFQDLARSGWAVPEAGHSLARKIMERKARRLDDDQYQAEWRRLNDHDRTVYDLAAAVREYRYMGRPSGEQTHVIQGLGAPLARITTSLAAQLVEYVISIVNLAYRRNDD